MGKYNNLKKRNSIILFLFIIHTKGIQIKIEKGKQKKERGRKENNGRSNTLKKTLPQNYTILQIWGWHKKTFNVWTPPPVLIWTLFKKMSNKE